MLKTNSIYAELEVAVEGKDINEQEVTDQQPVKEEVQKPMKEEVQSEQPESSTEPQPAPVATEPTTEQVIAREAVPQLTQPVPAQTPEHITPTQIVLQWLTYAFWGWTVLAMSVLCSTVIANFITGAETGGFTPYGIAAVLVLLPISIVCETFYSKKEPARIVGPSAIVMVVHAVIFGIFGIGAVIGAVFFLVSMLTGDDSAKSGQVGVISSSIIAILYAVVFLRTVNPKKMPYVKKYFVMFMTISVGLVALLGIVGPVAKERAARPDRMINSSLSYITQSIDDYAEDNGRLPESLDQLEFRNDQAKEVVNKGLVEYKPNTRSSTRDGGISSYLSSNSNYREVFYYQLCVEYKQEDRSDSYYYKSSEYDTYISTYGHPSGKVCYKVKTRDY